jgi:hypothetical protein
MRITWRVPVVLLAASISASHGEEKAITLDFGKLAEGKGWTVHNLTAEAAKVDGKSAVRLKAKGDSANGIVGLALADGVEFATGTIEIDLKGKSVRPSFVGVAFNVTDEKTFEAVYFRAFNFKAEGEFKSRAVQYICWPDYPWDKLCKDKPGKFEGHVDSVPDPDKWFHARIEVGKKQVRVYVNDAKEPCLTADRLAEGGKERPVGLFVDTGDGHYSDFRFLPGR